MNRSELTRTERRLLEYLAANADRTVSRSEMLASVWRLDPARVLTRTVDMHIAKLRAKLRDPRTLVTVHRRGYMLRIR